MTTTPSFDELTLSGPEYDPVIFGFIQALRRAAHTVVKPFSLTHYELELLTLHYLFLHRRTDFLRHCGKALSECEIDMRRLTEHRLDLIKTAIGDDSFAFVAAPLDDWWQRCVSRVGLFNGVSPCGACRAPRSHADVSERADDLCAACRKSVAEGREDTKGLPALWQELVTTTVNLEDALNAPLIDWEAPTGPAADVAVPFVNAVLEQLNWAATHSYSPESAVIHRFLSVLRLALLHDMERNQVGPQSKPRSATNPAFPKESEGLGPIGNEQLATGIVEGVNDASAALVNDFTPTEYELGVVATHYYERAAAIEYYGLLGNYGSYESRLRSFAERRLRTIADALGDDKFNTATADKRAEWAKRFAEFEEERSKAA